MVPAFWKLIDVADEDTNSIPPDDANMMSIWLVINLLLSQKRGSSGNVFLSRPFLKSHLGPFCFSWPQKLCVC